jgi:hypothetical protein
MSETSTGITKMLTPREAVRPCRPSEWTMRRWCRNQGLEGAVRAGRFLVDPGIHNRRDAGNPDMSDRFRVSRVYALPKPTPPGPLDNPIGFAGDVSCRDIHGPLASPAPTVSPASTCDIGALQKEKN